MSPVQKRTEVRLGRLVPLRVELVVETAAESKADQEVELGLPDKARAAAVWICANNIERTISSCGHKGEADAFPVCLGPHVQENHVNGVRVRAMQGGATGERPERTVAAFQEGDYAPYGTAHRVLLTKDMREPVVDFASIQAVLVLQPSLNVEGHMRMIAGVARASPEKMEGRALLFGAKGAAAIRGKFIAAFAKGLQVVHLACVPDNYEEHLTCSFSPACRWGEENARFQRLVISCADGFAVDEAKSLKREARDAATEGSAARDRSRSPRPPPSTGSA